jgi:hypothetical protein
MTVAPSSNVRVKIDSIETLSSQEHLGVMSHLERKIIVSGLSKMDYTVLAEAMVQVGVPAPRSTLPEHPNLVLVDINEELIDQDKVSLHLIYEHFMNVDQDADNPIDGYNIFGELKATTQQVPSNLDENGELIVVEHTYASEGDDADPEFGGLTKQQTGEIQVFSAQATFTFKFLKATSTPALYSAALLGKLNSVSWYGDPRTWLCTSVGWKLFDRGEGPMTYRFELEFQYKGDGWDPTAVFIDERTGRPPAGLVIDVGYKTIPYLGEANFEEVLGVYLR